MFQTFTELIELLFMGVNWSIVEKETEKHMQ